MGDIGERFAHSHKHDIVDRFASEFFNGEHLPYDFGRSEVASESGESGGAKFASVSATDLGGDTDGFSAGLFAFQPFVGRDEDSFDITAVVEAEEKFTSGVFGPFCIDVLEVGDVKMGAEVFSHGRGEVAHVLDGINALLVEPFEYLLGTIRFFAMFFEISFKILFAESKEGWVGGRCAHGGFCITNFLKGTGNHG